MSMAYSISSLEEAKAYLIHPVLGPRLAECTRLVSQVGGRSIEHILGHTDSLKFHSSMTLFAHAAQDNEIFQNALQRFFGGKLDHLTMDRLPAR